MKISRHYFNRVIAVFSVGLLASLPSIAKAESEPNDSFGAADVIAIQGNESGEVGVGAEDYFRIPNTNGYQIIEVVVTFPVMFNGDENYLTIFDKILQPIHSHTFYEYNKRENLYRISPAGLGDNFFIQIQGNPVFGTNSYTIQVIGRRDVTTLRKIDSIKKKIRKTKESIKEARRKHSNSKVNRLKRKLRRLKRKLRVLRVRLNNP